jgi:ribosomal protein S18 acetylase RimI-like enzyme
MIIRPARIDDAVAIARVHVRAWQRAYRGIVPDAYLDSLSIEKRESIWRQSLANGAPEVAVAEQGPEVVGWIAFGPSRDSDAAREIGEIEALYVAPEHWSLGAGRALLQIARERLRERGFHRVSLWVLAQNARAIRFYTAAGFTPGCERPIEIGGAVLTEIRYELFIG